MEKEQLRDSEGKFESRQTRMWRYVGYIWIAVFVMAGINFVVSSAVKYHTTHNYGVRSWIKETQSIFYSEEIPSEQEVLSPVVTTKVEVANAESTPEWYQELSDLEKKICDKWGVYECKNAVARCRAETGCRQQDSDGRTIASPTNDIGAMQINEAHWGYKSPSYKAECDLTELVTEDGNIDCAYIVWQASGWGAWSTSHNGSADAELTAMR